MLHSALHVLSTGALSATKTPGGGETGKILNCLFAWCCGVCLAIRRHNQLFCKHKKINYKEKSVKLIASLVKIPLLLPVHPHNLLPPLCQLPNSAVAAVQNSGMDG